MKVLLIAYIKEVMFENEYVSHGIHVKDNAVCILIEASPRESVHRIVSQIKDYTVKRLKKDFPELKSKLPCIWTRNYYASTIGDCTNEVVEEYIESQKNV